MKTFVLPIQEVNTGYYLIDADSLEEALAIVELGEFTDTEEPRWRGGYTDWYPEQMEEEVKY